MPNIGRTETEAMLAGVVRNHPNDHFLQIPRVDNVARCYVCELVPGLKNAMLDFTGVTIRDWIQNHLQQSEIKKFARIKSVSILLHIFHCIPRN